jgi:hypothetical protein
MKTTIAVLAFLVVFTALAIGVYAQDASPSPSPTAVPDGAPQTGFGPH